jgi:hypothetical protein
MTTVARPAAPRGVPLRNKVGIAGGEAGLVISTVVFNTWSLYFLVNIAEVPGWQAGLLFLFARLFDAVNDPFLGDLIDRRVDRTPRLWWVRRFSLPASALFVAFFALPFAPGPVLLYLLVALCISSIATTLSGTAVLSLIPILARSYHERTGLVSWRVAAGTTVSLVGIAGPPAIVLGVTGDRDLAASDPSGWVVMGSLFGLLMLRASRSPRWRSASRRRRGRGAGAPEQRPAAPAVAPRRLPVGVLPDARDQRRDHRRDGRRCPFFLESVLGMDAGQQSIVLGGFFLTAGAVDPARSAPGRAGGQAARPRRLQRAVRRRPAAVRHAAAALRPAAAGPARHAHRGDRLRRRAPDAQRHGAGRRGVHRGGDR